MFLRRLRTSAALRRAATDGGVLAALRAELTHELSSSSAAPPPFRSQDAPDFATVSDDPRAQDVVIRRRFGSDEVLVSAVLAPLLFVEFEEPERPALMKVFVSKQGAAAPVLQFDCRATTAVRWEDDGPVVEVCRIEAVRYHSSPLGDAAGEDKYQGSPYSDLDPRLQLALDEYLQARGVDSKLATSLYRHLVEKERAQYVNWLKIMEEAFVKDHSPCL